MIRGTNETHLCETLRPPTADGKFHPQSNRLRRLNPETMANGSRQGPCGAALALANACSNPWGTCRNVRGTCRIYWGDLQVMCGGFVGQSGGLPATIRPLCWGAFFRDVSRVSPSATIFRPLVWGRNFPTHSPHISHKCLTNFSQIPTHVHTFPQIPTNFHNNTQGGFNSCAASRLPSAGGGSTKSHDRSAIATDGTQV